MGEKVWLLCYECRISSLIVRCTNHTSNKENDDVSLEIKLHFLPLQSKKYTFCSIRLYSYIETFVNVNKRIQQKRRGCKYTWKKKPKKMLVAALSC